jgi:hypothetical protein
LNALGAVAPADRLPGDELAPAALATDEAADEADELVVASSEAGVPARLAHPAANGPFGSQTTSASGAAIEASTADARTPE